MKYYTALTYISCFSGLWPTVNILERRHPNLETTRRFGIQLLLLLATMRQQQHTEIIGIDYICPRVLLGSHLPLKLNQ